MARLPCVAESEAWVPRDLIYGSLMANEAIFAFQFLAANRVIYLLFLLIFSQLRFFEV